MFIPKIRMSFGWYSDSKFEQKTEAILQAMQGNADFTDPEPTMVAYQAALKAYSTALTEAATLDRNAVAKKKEARQQLQTLTIQIGSYVMNRSNGNERMLISSGFALTKRPEPRKLPDMGPVALSNTGNSGEMRVTATKLAGANGYVYEFTEVAPTEATKWTSIATSTSKFVVKGLTPGRQYWFRVIATGARQQVQYSPVASQFAQ